MGKKNGEDNDRHSSSGKSKWIFLVTTALVVVLLIVLFMMTTKTPTQTATTSAGQGAALQEPAQAAQAGKEGITGQVYNIFVQNLLGAGDFPAGKAAINPDKGVILIDSATGAGIPFGVNIAQKGSIAGVNDGDPACTYKGKIYEFTFSYNTQHVSYDAIKDISNIGNGATFTIEQDSTANNMRTIKYKASFAAIDDYFCIAQYKELVELSFTPLTSAWENNVDSTTITLSSFNVIFKDAVVTYNLFGNGQFYIRKKFYLDFDGDKYGVETAEPTIIDQADDHYFKKSELNGLLVPSGHATQKGDCDDHEPNAYPTNAEIFCDGIDNNCVNGMSDEDPSSLCYRPDLMMTAPNAVYSCGLHYVCKDKNPMILDCDNPGNKGVPAAQWTFKDSDTLCGQLFTQYGDQQLPLIKGPSCIAGTCQKASVPVCDDCIKYPPYIQCLSDKQACEDEKQVLATQINALNVQIVSLKNELSLCKSGMKGCLFWVTDLASSVTLDKLNAALTPGCGKDANGDGDKCDPFEHYLNCPADCDPCATSSDPTCNSCEELNKNNIGQIGFPLNCNTDTDKDGLPDAYETWKDPAGKWFNPITEDTDNDGVKDRRDFCPQTLTAKGQLKFGITTGQVGLNGCYIGDVGREKDTKSDYVLGPDGCFSIFDTTSLISYYSKPGAPAPDQCTNLYSFLVK